MFFTSIFIMAVGATAVGIVHTFLAFNIDNFDMLLATISKIPTLVFLLQYFVKSLGKGNRTNKLNFKRI